MTTQATITDLPFVVAHADGQKNLWSVQAAGDWASDCVTGADYGSTLLSYMRQADNPSTLGLIVQAMAQRGEWTGVECGFLHAIAEAALR